MSDEEYQRCLKQLDRNRDEDDDDDDEDDDEDRKNQRRTRNSRDLPVPVTNWTLERRIQKLVDSGYSEGDAALVALASPPPGYSGHAFDLGPGQGTSSRFSADAQYIDMPPPASLPRDSEYGRDGRAVKPLTRTPPGMPDADEDDHSVESMMKFAARTDDLPLPNTVQRLVAEAGNRRAQEEKQARETH
jgi:hypothetical protein